ncbi:nuclear transport factor 2 family protein [Actinomadura darangshiensis]|uniref:Nuclear transport factor 2 family protein n=1 Tax=Actinomadura darangshiensis TaxID=705336 RepID=A0A4R5BXW5_9ACTN|nr:nuclear transport factor 2 family protein [Actinomadura darangshiensis]TDD91115.1 nuclear transport factor 2 family protein [Actinomadura darangshiensis]
MTLGVVDQIALGDLVARYALYADRRDIDAMAGLFTEDAVLVLPDAPEKLDPVRAFTGRGEITKTLSVLNDIPLTFHALAGQVFDVGAELGRATGEIACVAHHMTSREDGKASDLVWHCRYTDTYRLDGRTWRIARREQRIDSIETRPVRRWRGE